MPLNAEISGSFGDHGICCSIGALFIWHRCFELMLRLAASLNGGDPTATSAVSRAAISNNCAGGVGLGGVGHCGSCE